MASIGPLRVRDLNPPCSLIPPGAWADVVERLGDVVIANACTRRNVSGVLSVVFAPDQNAVDRVRAVLAEHGLCSIEVEPWSSDPEGWAPQDPDAWKA